ncbi:MAG: hypothetical protein AAGE65_04790 [Planctomycetota bacterium]
MSARFAFLGIAVVLAFGSTANADYPLTWYASSTNGASDPDEVAADGLSRAIVYSASDQVAQAQAYLDKAEAQGVRVILDIGRDHLKNPDPAGLAEYVRRFRDHPALEGWYVYDEPNLTGTSVQQARNAYQTIRSLTDLPIYGGLNANNFQAQLDYADSHDHRLTFRYVLDLGDAEFEGFELDDRDRYGSERGWKDFVSTSAANARAAGKPWSMVIQAYGQEADGRPLRLPTEAELRFMVFYPIVAHDADGLMFWALYRTVRSDSRLGEPYPFNGSAWRRNVFRPVIAEFNDHFGDALGAGAITDGVASSDPGDVHADLYEDPETETAYLLVVNDEGEAQTATLTLGEAFAGSFDAARSIDAAVGVALNDDALTVELGPYETRAYVLNRRRVIPEPTAAVWLTMLATLSRFRF